MRPIAQYAMKGRRQAFFLAMLFALIPFLGWLGAAIMGLVTLRRGPKEGFLLFLGLTLADLVYFSAGSVGLGYFLYDTFCNNFLTFLAACYLRHRASSWSQLIEGLTYLGLAAVVGVHLLYPAITPWWAAHLEQLFISLNNLTGAEVAHHTSQALAQSTAQYATGIQAALTLIMVTFNLIVARYMQASLYNPGGLRRELTSLHISRRMAFLTIAICILPWLHFGFAKDLLPITTVPFLFSGISLFHDFVFKSRRQWAWLITFYALLLLALPYLCLIFIIVGLLDTFYNLRAYLKNHTQS